MSGGNISILVGLPPQYRSAAAKLYYLAFKQKLHPIFRNESKGIQVLEQSLDTSHAIVAMMDGELVGIAGFKDKQGNLVDINPVVMTSIFGFVGGWVRLLALSIFSRSNQNNVLLMDGIVVDLNLRGSGIGSLLLDAVVEFARTNGYTSVRLDVVDTNPRAYQLYKRKGFTEVSSQTYPLLRHLFGFSGSTTMLKTVENDQ